MSTDTYLENRILSASPIELIQLLYEGTQKTVAAARRHLASGDIRARSDSISKACELLAELSGSLDHGTGGELSRRLGELYGYMQQRLIQANCEQADAPLAEVQGLVATLAEAWAGVASSAASQNAQAGQVPGPWAWNIEDHAPAVSGGWTL